MSGDLAPGINNSYILIRWIFVRFISLIYFLAFLSFLLEAPGLYGSQGILPVADFVSANFNSGGTTALSNLLDFPSVFLFFNDDQALLAIPLLAMFLATIAMAGIMPGFCLLVLWSLYLSIVNAGQDFMSFQWDILLLEVGFLSIFFASWKPLDLLPGLAANSKPWVTEVLKRFEKLGLMENGQPSIAVIWLFRWLAFRLLFASGLVKVGDRTWDSLTAMSYHYETQPLPTPLGWLAHHLPGWFQSLSTVGALGVELMVPFMFFGPRSWRWIACLIQLGLQLLIMATGNFCFFNWLTIALCLLLLDDKHLYRIWTFLRNKIKRLECFEYSLIDGESDRNRKPSKLRLFVLVPLISIISLLSVHNFILLNPLSFYIPGPMMGMVNRAYSYHLVNSYGLFARMTTERPEIVVEGSRDGKEWLAYEFKYKPGRLDRMPPLIAPLQPRLDWQMWFAALGSLDHNPWFLKFSYRLLTDSHPVEGLLAKNPFSQGGPPRFLRARVYMYKMTSIEELFKSGRWWRREFTQEYMPAISLKVGDQKK